MKKELIKKWELALIMGFMLTVICSFVGFGNTCEEVRDSVLRLHIRANSDLPEDQELKLQVRDRLVIESQELFEYTTSKEEAEQQVYDNLPKIQAIAEDEVQARGYDYPVEVTLGEQYFETRFYNEVTLPAGVYNSVIINIGSGEGKNWWCVMFPPMCLPAADEQRELETVIPKEDVEVLENYDDYKFKFKTVEMFEKFKHKLKN